MFHRNSSQQKPRSAVAIDSQDESLLVSLLAQQDAIFHIPRVDPCTMAWNGWWAKRLDYPHSGMPWHSGGKTAADWNEAERKLKSLVGAGFVDPFRGSKKTLAVRITPAGDAYARALCDAPDRADAVNACRTLASLDTHPDLCFEEGWIAEIAFNDGRGWSNDDHQGLFVAATWLILPGLLGWVRTGVCRNGRAFYRLTDEGRRAAADESDEKKRAAGLPDDPREESADAYFKQLVQGVKSLRGSTEAIREIGNCPLPDAMCSLRDLAELEIEFAEEDAARAAEEAAELAANEAIPV